jgi:hypothetical protein
MSIFLSVFNSIYPLYITKHRSEHFKYAIKDILQKCTFDGIFCDHSCMIESALWGATKQKGIPVFVRLHNIEFKIWERYADRLSRFNPVHWFIASQAKKLKSFEAMHYDKVSMCYAITHHDAMIAKHISPQASISRSYMSKAERGWKLGRRDTAPTHDQRLVSHTPVAPTSGSSPYSSILGPATRRRAQHHP